MKSLFSITLILCSTFPALTQERVLAQTEFDSVFRASRDMWTAWKDKAFRKTVTVETTSPTRNYKVSRTVEFDGKGASRAVSYEYVEGKEHRIIREIIGVGSVHYIRDVARGNWWKTGDTQLEESPATLAYAPDPFEVQAIQAHFVRSKFDKTSKESSYAFVGADQIKNAPVTVYKATERIEGREKKSGLKMETDAAMKYWFGRDGILVRSESVSNGHIGKDIYYLKIIAIWELDPSITITPPVPPT